MAWQNLQEDLEEEFLSLTGTAFDQEGRNPYQIWGVTEAKETTAGGKSRSKGRCFQVSRWTYYEPSTLNSHPVPFWKRPKVQAQAYMRKQRNIRMTPALRKHFEYLAKRQPRRKAWL